MYISIIVDEVKRFYAQEAAVIIWVEDIERAKKFSDLPEVFRTLKTLTQYRLPCNPKIVGE